jgi:hypothetical protein
VEEISISETVDPAGVLHRRTRLKLHDKKGALDSLARHLGMFVDRQVAESSYEVRVKNMTTEERLALVDEILEKGRKYVPLVGEYKRKRRRKAEVSS